MAAGDWFHLAGIALCLFALWAIARHDWLRLTRPSRRVLGEVSGHRKTIDGDGSNWAAVYRFQSEDGPHEVIDQVLSASPSPPLGAMQELTYPAGHPGLARPPRPLMWGMVYLLLVVMMAMLTASWLGLLPED
jgi:hypothetical protein